jgi:hypothetical protein
MVTRMSMTLPRWSTITAMLTFPWRLCGLILTTWIAAGCLLWIPSASPLRRCVS